MSKNTAAPVKNIALTGKRAKLPNIQGSAGKDASAVSTKNTSNLSKPNQSRSK
jgi:hypothetical protein